MLYVTYPISPNVPLLTGHFREGTTGRTLTIGATTIGAAANLTVANCLSACQASGYNLAGVEYSGECCKSEMKAKRNRY
jgi:hypothetical protein